MVIPVGTVGSENRDRFRRSVLEPLFASTYIRRTYRTNAGTETNLSRGYENGEVLVFGDGGINFRDLEEVSSESFEISGDWRDNFWNTWTRDEAALWLIQEMEPRLRQALIFLNNVYGPLNKYDETMGTERGQDTMRFLGLVPESTAEINLFDIGSSDRDKRENAKRIVQTLLMFDDGYGCLSREQRQMETYAYPARMPVKFTNAYFGTRFLALGYWETVTVSVPGSPLSVGDRFVNIENLPDIEDGEGLLGPDPRSFIAWTENAFPEEEEIIIPGPSSSTTDVRPATRDIQCPIRPRPEASFGPGDRPTAAETPLPCPESDLAEGLSREDICTPDTSAQVPDWTQNMMPFLNSRICEYFVPVQTTYNCVGNEDLIDRVLEYSDQAVQSMLDFLNKDATEQQRTILRNFISAGGYYEFDKVPNVDVKLLYRWPFGLVKALRLQDRAALTLGEVAPSVNSSELSMSNILVSLDTLKLILENLSPQQVNMWSLEREKILLDGTAQEINVFEESKQVSYFKAAMLNLLGSNGYTLPVVNQKQPPGSEFTIVSEEIVVEGLQIYYDTNFRLISCFARDIGGEYQELSLGTLPPSSVFRNPTMLSYLVNLEDIIIEYNNTQQIDISIFLQRYHYPSTRIANQASLGDPPLLPANCSGGALEDAANSVLNSLTDSAKELLDRFASNLCMTPQEAARRETEIESSIEELKAILSEQNMINVALQDPIISNISSTINGISDSRDTVTAAWSNLFDKLTACGLFTLTSQTIETIAKNDICGISPQRALITAIKASLKKTNGQALKAIFDGLPANYRTEIENLYSNRFREYAEQLRYNGPSGFPWDLDEQNRQLERDRKQGRILYDGSLFTAPSLAQTESRYQNSYRAGYQAGISFDPFDDLSSLSSGNYDEGSFWLGFVTAQNDVLDGTPQALATVVPPPRADVLTDAQRLESNSPSTSSSAFGQLVGGLTADTINFGFETFVEILVDSLGFDELISQVQNTPMLSTILSVAEDITSCAVDVRFTSGQEGGEEITLGAIQNNLQNGLKADICEVAGGLRSLTLPDIEATLNSALNTETIKAAFVNALVDTLKNLLIKILVNTLLQLIRKATQVLQGALCEATRGNLSAAIEGAVAGNVATQVYTPPGNIINLFADAFCGPGTQSPGLDDQVYSILSSMAGGTAVTASGGASCSLVDSLASRLRMDQLIDLMQGTASENVIEIVLTVSRNECPEFSDFLFDDASVRSFFQNLSTAFPGEFLSDARAGLQIFGGDRQDIITTCNIEPNLSGFEEALREDCGDRISEEQIQIQLQSFQEKLEDTIADMSSVMTTGFSESMTDTIQTALSNIVPKDDPTNVVLVKQIVDSMFDPYYLAYTNGLMNPLAPNGNGGYMNMVLSNRNSTPIVGQHAAFGAAVAFGLGPLAPFLPIVGGDLEGVVDNLRASYFGDRELSILPKLKPDTVARYLQNLLSDGTYISEGESEEAVKLLYTSVLTLPTFDINYNFATGEGQLQKYGPFGQPSTSEGSLLKLESSDPSLVYSQIETYLNNSRYGVAPSDFHNSFFGDSGRTPLTIGASYLLYNLFTTNVIADFFDPSTWSFPPVELSDLSNDTQTLLGGLRQETIRSLGRSVSFNTNAFSYGVYNLDAINDNDITPAVNPELVEEGYEIFYLDDGNIVVIPPRKGGWLELKDILLPNRQDEYCCPDKKDLLDIPSIKGSTIRAFESSDEDERIYQNPKKVREAPYSHIMGRTTAACIDGTVTTTIRIHLIENILSGYASLSKYKTDFPSVYSDILADYVAKKMRAGLRSQKPNPAGPPVPSNARESIEEMIGEFAEALGVASDEVTIDPAERGLYGYWYEFLEQCVQIYLNRAEAGNVTITQQADRALRQISDFSRDYSYPQRAELRRVRQTRPFMTLKKLRREKNILAIQATENLATVILKELIKEEFNRVSRDIESIFPTPEGGWVSDVTLDFLRNGYYIDNRNIFDVPKIDGDILNGERGDLNFDDNGHFILQSYIRPSLNELSPRYSSLSANIASGQIYGLQEMRERMELSGFADDGLGFGGDNNLNDHFTSFRYGLRLVYVLGDQTVADVGGGESALISLLNRDDDTSRLFRHRSDSLDTRFSIPIAFSENFEKQIEDPQISVFFRKTQPGILSLQSIDNSNHFNWPLLTQLMIGSYEFQTMFDYAIPLTTIQSLNTVFNIESFLHSVGRDDDWDRPNTQSPISDETARPRAPVTYLSWNRKGFPVMKRRLKRAFKILYKANDFSYDPSDSSIDNDQIRDLSERTNADSWSDRLTPETRSRIIFEDPTCFDGETTAVVPGLPTPGSTASSGGSIGTTGGTSTTAPGSPSLGPGPSPTTGGSGGGYTATPGGVPAGSSYTGISGLTAGTPGVPRNAFVLLEYHYYPSSTSPLMSRFRTDMDPAGTAGWAGPDRSGQGGHQQGVYQEIRPLATMTEYFLRLFPTVIAPPDTHIGAEYVTEDFESPGIYPPAWYEFRVVNGYIDEIERHGRDQPYIRGSGQPERGQWGGQRFVLQYYTILDPAGVPYEERAAWSAMRPGTSRGRVSDIFHTSAPGSPQRIGDIPDPRDTRTVP